MYAHVFTVKRPLSNDIDIDTIYKEFGNVPGFCPYEGPLDGPVYLCCIDVSIDVKKIFTKYGYECDSLRRMEFDDSKYNSSYRIGPTYRRDVDYELKLNDC